MVTEEIAILQRARERMAEVRYDTARALSEPLDRGKLEIFRKQIADTQAAIDAIDKAILDEQGHLSSEPTGE